MRAGLGPAWGGQVSGTHHLEILYKQTNNSEPVGVAALREVRRFSRTFARDQFQRGLKESRKPLSSGKIKRYSVQPRHIQAKARKYRTSPSFQGVRYGASFLPSPNETKKADPDSLTADQSPTQRDGSVYAEGGEAHALGNPPPWRAHHQLQWL